jgi:hypothetical protein
MRHLLLVSILLASTNMVCAEQKDPLVMSFATVGDSRTEPGLSQPKQDQIWLQNTKAWSRIIREMQAKKPHALFFNGDMIMGYTTDKNVLNRQYAYWRGMVTALQETGTYVLPVPGNHEVQVNVKEKGKSKKIAQQSNEDSWRDNMGDLIIDAERWKATVGSNLSAFDPKNTPAIGGEDQINTDQSQLTYSFDFAGSHFAVINTDPVGNDSHAPVAWLTKDFAQAKARGAKHFFVFGHKLAFTYFFKPDIGAQGLDQFPDNQQAFWKVVEDYAATYFCGHEHIYNVMQPTKNVGGKAYQVIVGSGGSPFSADPGETQNPTDRMYAWALVRVYASGKVLIDTYGFDEHYGKTRLLDHIVIQ